MEILKVFIGLLEVTTVLCFNARWFKIFVEKSIIDERQLLYESIANDINSADDFAVIQFIFRGFSCLFPY